MQILWINIVTEGTVTVNLVMDPPDGDEMRRAPVPQRRPPARPRDAGARGADGPVIAAVTFGWFAWRIGQGAALELVRTETFTVLAMCQWFNVLNCQSATRSALRLGVLSNPWLLGGLSLSVLLQVAVIYFEPMNTLFHTAPLPPTTLLALLALTSLVLWAEELRKWAFRLRRGRQGADHPDERLA